MSSTACRSTAGTRASGTSTLKKILAAVLSGTLRTGRRASSPRRALRRRSPPCSRLWAVASSDCLCGRHPRLRFLPFFRVIVRVKSTRHRKSESNTHHSQGWRIGTRTLRHRPQQLL